MNVITFVFITLYIPTLGQSSRINVLFPKSKCYEKESNNKVVVEDIKKRLLNLDERYELKLEEEFSQFDYSGGFNNLQLLDQCIMRINLNLSENVVCPAIKDIYLLEHITQKRYLHLLYITDPIINIQFGINCPETYYFTHLNYLFKIFHSSVWSILLLISLIIGITIFSIEFLGQLEYPKEKRGGITVQASLFITFSALWIPTVYNYLKTTSAKFIFHIWQLFIVIMLILYSSGVISLVLNINNKTENKSIDHLRTEKIICIEETKTICNALKTEYFNINIMKNKCDEGINYLNYHTENLNPKIYKEQINLFQNNDLVFVSDNITLVREINIKLLSNKKNIMNSMILYKNKLNKSSSFIEIPIKLKHIYGLILMLMVGCIVVSSIFLALILKKKISVKIKNIWKKNKNNQKRNNQSYITSTNENTNDVNLIKKRETEV